MNVDFNPIYDALFATIVAAVSSVGTIKTSSRILRHWDDIPLADQPALFMTKSTIHASSINRNNLLTVWRLGAKVYLYVNTGLGMPPRPDDEPPDRIMNPLLYALVNALQPSPGIKEQTLGGLVTMCRVEGEIITDEGLLGSQGVLIIPVAAIVAG